jgi:hypothetical protein
MAMNEWLKGNYIPRNPRKYKGDISKIVYRSSWERTFMVWCDTDPDIIAWSSETVIVPYYDPVKKCERKYHVDFRIVTKGTDGVPQVTLIEIKPHKQTQKPRQSRAKSDKTMLTEATTWLTNQAKWKAAEKLCKALGWKFFIITEKELYGGIDRGFQPPSSPQAAKRKAGQG